MAHQRRTTVQGPLSFINPTHLFMVILLILNENRMLFEKKLQLTSAEHLMWKKLGAILKILNFLRSKFLILVNGIAVADL